MRKGRSSGFRAVMHHQCRRLTADAIRAFEDLDPTPAFRRRFESAWGYITHILRIEKLTRTIRTDGEPVRLLDFGCGWGKFIAACREFGFDAIGVDRSSPRAEGSAIRIFSSLDEIRGLSRFHAITLFEVLEHLDEPGAILRTLAERVVPGGLLILETPDCSGVTAIESRRDYLKIHPLEHINAFTHRTLTSIAERHGFSLIQRGSAHVTTEDYRAAKQAVKRFLGRDGRSTQLYFERSPAFTK